MADATAGLGRDAFLLAVLGLEVTLIERSADIHAALAAGLARAVQAGPPVATIAGRMSLIHGDARDHLERLAPDIVLVDPMHPPRAGAALVKKAMRDIRALVGADPDAPDLLACALRAASDRVVLKWPLRAAPPAGAPEPSHSIVGKTVRYDVFVRAGRQLAASPPSVT